MTPKENDLEGVQDQGGKHGGQAGMPKPVQRPKQAKSDQDVVQKGKKVSNSRTRVEIPTERGASAPKRE
jgi:hypothetical protein